MSENIGFTDSKDCGACSLWNDVPLRNFLTYTNVSACKFSHRKMCLYTTCHIIFYACARPTCFHAVCRLRDVFMCVYAHKKDVCLHTFRIRNIWVCVTFNTWHPAHRHVLICEYLHTGMSLQVKTLRKVVSFFTVNTPHSPSHPSNNLLKHGFVCQKLHEEKDS